jgi:hypothetical protein
MNELVITNICEKDYELILGAITNAILDVGMDAKYSVIIKNCGILTMKNSKTKILR